MLWEISAFEEGMADKESLVMFPRKCARQGTTTQALFFSSDSYTRSESEQGHCYSPFRKHDAHQTRK